jgi:hypothetical protein
MPLNNFFFLIHNFFFGGFGGRPEPSPDLGHAHAHQIKSTIALVLGVEEQLQ